MKRTEIKMYKGARVRVDYQNKVSAINSICGVLTHILSSKIVLQPFGTTTELLIYIDRVDSIVKINGH